jgi:hypothetical protein
VRGALADPLRARLEYQDAAGEVRPLVDVPVRFALGRPGAATLLPESSTTDARGEIACRVTDLRPTGLAANEITVRPGFWDVAPDLADSHVPVASFTYHLPTAAGTTVLLAVEDDYEGRPLSTPVVEPALAAWLSRFGFDVRTPGEGRAALVSAGAGRLVELVDADVDYVVRGRATSRHSSEERGLQWFRASANLELLHLGSGRSSAVEVGEVKNAHRDRSEAGGIGALRLLEEPLRASLETAFVADFVPASNLQP